MSCSHSLWRCNQITWEGKRWEGVDRNLRRFQSSLCKGNGRGLASAPLPRIVEQSWGPEPGADREHPLVFGEELAPGPPESSWLCMHGARPALTILQLSLTWPCSPSAFKCLSLCELTTSPKQATFPSVVGDFAHYVPTPCLGQTYCCFPSALHLDIIPFFSCYLFSKYV